MHLITFGFLFLYSWGQFLGNLSLVLTFTTQNDFKRQFGFLKNGREKENLKYGAHWRADHSQWQV